MKTTIETTDYIHATGMRMVSLKDIETSFPEHWENEETTDAEREQITSRMHAADIAIAEYRGKIAEGTGDADKLEEVIADLQDAGDDPDSYLILCGGIDKALENGNGRS